jgi:hypothetical protein
MYFTSQMKKVKSGKREKVGNRMDVCIGCVKKEMLISDWPKIQAIFFQSTFFFFSPSRPNARRPKELAVRNGTLRTQPCRTFVLPTVAVARLLVVSFTPALHAPCGLDKFPLLWSSLDAKIAFLQTFLAFVALKSASPHLFRTSLFCFSFPGLECFARTTHAVLLFHVSHTCVPCPRCIVTTTRDALADIVFPLSFRENYFGSSPRCS